MTDPVHAKRGIYVNIIVEPEVCVGCGVCVDSCPTDVFRMGQANKARAEFPEDCQACFLCVIDCPVGALGLELKRLEPEDIGPTADELRTTR